MSLSGHRADGYHQRPRCRGSKKNLDHALNHSMLVLWCLLLCVQTSSRGGCVVCDCQRLTDRQVVSAPGGARLPGQETQVLRAQRRQRPNVETKQVIVLHYGRGVKCARNGAPFCGLHAILILHGITCLGIPSWYDLSHAATFSVALSNTPSVRNGQWITNMVRFS